MDVIQENLTPLMQQYSDIKKEHKNSIVFFRLGDFYEMFEEDAKIASKILNITLTARAGTPMCGIPYHSSNAYILKLLKAGKKIAICEQLESPQKGTKIVKRGVVRTITPGTIIEENFLTENENNFLFAISLDEKARGFAIAVIDVSTIEMRGAFISGKNMQMELKMEIGKYSPKEIIISENILNDKKFMRIFDDTNASISVVSNNEIIPNISKDMQINFSSDGKNIYSVADMLLSYLKKNYNTLVPLIRNVFVYEINNFLHLSSNTIRHLELVENFYSKERKFSLLDVLDKTMTPMGSRLLKKWLLEPLVDKQEINKRLDFVEFFYQNKNLGLTKDLRQILRNIQDFERTLTRINCGANVPRELIAVKNVLNLIPSIKESFIKNNIEINNPKIVDFFTPVDLEIFPKIVNMIESCLIENPPNNLKDGNIIKTGFDDELDRLRELKIKAGSILADYETTEKHRLKIPTLKIRFNNVFGYFIEVSKSYKDLVPNDYLRIQTLANAERFTTEKLKNYEIEILEADQKALDIEIQIYNKLRDFVNMHYQELTKFVEIIRIADVYTNLAFIAIDNNYTRPILNDGYDFEIKDGRHPVVEKIFSESDFVANGTIFKENGTHLYLITGPNMAGKSTYIRQVALMIIMAQMGSFVPAKSAELGIVDKIFTRIGSGDKLIKGESTFMVEMKETVEIIKEATPKSLVILDEVGRGTSTFDGISLAWVIASELTNREWKKDELGPKTLFATHYLELTELENVFPDKVKNYNLKINDMGEEIIFLHKVIEGSGDKSYGIHVAKMAGMPTLLIQKAKKKLKELEEITKQEFAENNENIQFSFFEANNKVLDELKNVNLNELSPVEALLKIKDWKDSL